MTTSTQTSGKAAAAAAAKALLADRIALVESLGETIDRHRRKAEAVTMAQAAERDAADAVRAAYAAAQDGGWTAAELKSAGLTPPRGRRTRAASAAPHNPTESGERNNSHSDGADRP